ncbi:MAG: polysaccharide deacetylase family protein [Pseudomonadota bacterium]
MVRPPEKSRPLSGLARANLPGDARASLCVVVDTEEEFDWDGPFRRDATATEAIAEIGLIQDICEAHGFVPSYVIDYPVATDERAVKRLLTYAERGACEIGAHLHTWVNPPHEEIVSPFTSYQGNLDPALEAAKLAHLVETIAERFGKRPRMHKAGRYGFGPHTAEAMRACDLDIDLSAMPPFDFYTDGGPTYDDVGNGPYWIDRPGGLLALPNTGAFVGPLRARGAALQRFIDSPLGRRGFAGAVLSRTGLVQRLRLSPEGHDLSDLMKLTNALFALGERHFTLSLHSPTAKPGCTSYVQTADDLARFLGVFDGYLAWFRGAFGGVPTTPTALADRLREGL